MRSGSNNVSASTGGMGFAGVLAIVFIVLKLVGVINWSWLWVLSPIWISFALALLIWGIVMLVVVIQAAKSK